MHTTREHYTIFVHPSCIFSIQLSATRKQVAAVMAATDRIAAAPIDPSYSPGGANVGPQKFASKRHLDRFVRFAGLTRVPNAHTQTDHATQCVAIGCIYATHAMRPNNAIQPTNCLYDIYHSIRRAVSKPRSTVNRCIF